ncbi:MAG: two-component system sensor histidine kinase PfeS [Alcanivorax borkumensis]|jgi:two-component system sensor histidine kinase PfeS|uniref:histidine kinase sensor domain-containing protein n=1 Tax=Alcanivorax borkumensis TaxID=59754 RepID=UPI003EE8C6A1
MLKRYSLLWRLALLLVVTVVTTMVVGTRVTNALRNDAQLLSDQAVAVMRGYAAAAEQAWLAEGRAGVDQWLAGMRSRESGDIAVISNTDQSLSSTPLTVQERSGLRFQRGVHSRMSFRYGKKMPYLGLPFPTVPEQGSLLMQLPPRFRPGTYWPWVEPLLLVGVPTISALMLGGLLFWRARVLLKALQAQVLVFKDDTNARVVGPLATRSDEFGELARSFNHMAEQVCGILETQKQLLNDMSHELRTPLSRLSVALESGMNEQQLRQRLEQELRHMRTLVDDTLALGWQDTDTNTGNAGLQSLSVPVLWDMVVENAAFESGWSKQRFPCTLPADTEVYGNLNTLAQVFENLVRNAIRYSPEQGTVLLQGQREGSAWHLQVVDQGPGVPENKLHSIFAPFVRLNAARTTDSGFGLGLSTARRTVERLGGELWAHNRDPGLCVHLRLPAPARV